jgi:flagellar hook-associated protein 2
MPVSGANNSTSLSSGSNIDVNGLVTKLMAVEQKPLTAIKAKETSYQAKISAFGQVKSALSAFQTSLQGLGSNTKFQGNNATSSDTGSFTVSALSSASVGHHTIEVENLAQGQHLATPGINSNTTSIGNGTLTFDLGTVTGGEFIPNVGKYKTNTLNNATIASRTVPGNPGTTISLADTTTLTPDVNSSGTIPGGTLTINGIEVDDINLLDEDSPLHRAENIAEAFDKAYVESGGRSGTFTASQGKIIIKSEDGGKHVTFGVTGKATDSVNGAKTLTTISKQTGLSAAQLGTQAGNNSIVTVYSTAGLSLGDPISGGGFPDGTTITSVVDTTHFLTSAAGKESKGATLTTSSASGSKTIAIDDTNNSLEGIRDAINAAKIGITASVVNDGSETPFRLLLNADTVGANTNIRIGVGGGDPALNKLLSQDPIGTQNLTEIVGAKDAALVVDGIPVTKPGNVIKDVIQGVTITLLKPTSSPASVEVSRDVATVKTSVEEFVKSYNELKKVILDLTAYNAATKKGAALQGDSAMRSLDSQIESILSSPLGTPAGSLTTLSQIGVSKQTSGSLAIDSTKLNTALSTQFDEVAGLFAAIGKSTDSMVNFKATSPTTVPGSYAVAVSALGSQGSSIGRRNLNYGSTTIDKDTTINATVDGVSASVPLAAGEYSATQLAAMLQTAINGVNAFSTLGKSVSTTIDTNGALHINSNTYGSASKVILEDLAGTHVSDFMGSATNATGTDVSGMIEGAPATGTGQLLTSNGGKSSGLQVQVAGGPIGERGSVNYTQGYAHKLNDYVNLALGSNGVLTGRINGLGTSVRGLSKERDTINSRLVTVEDRYRRQYTKLDAALGKMNETSTYLSQQLSKM